MSTLRVGIIGCGGIAKRHAQGWLAQPGAKIVAVAEVDPYRAQEFAKEHDIEVVSSDYHEMLRDLDLDVVSICTWPGTHADATIAAAEAGVKGILCEKPMARSLGECDAMIEAAERSGAKLAIAHQHRFMPLNVTVRRLIHDGAIGVPTLIHSHIEGGLSNNGSHMIDRARYWMADPAATWVMAQVERRSNRHERKEPIEDRTGAIIAFENGCRMISETDTPKSNLDDAVFVGGTHGMLKLIARKQLYRLVDGDWREVPLDTTDDQHTELLAWMRGETEHRNRAAISRGTIEILQAIYESVRVRGLVELPLQNREVVLQQLIDEGRLPLDDDKREAYDIRL